MKYCQPVGLIKIGTNTRDEIDKNSGNENNIKNESGNVSESNNESKDKTLNDSKNETVRSRR